MSQRAQYMFHRSINPAPLSACFPASFLSLGPEIIAAGINAIRGRWLYLPLCLGMIVTITSYASAGEEEMIRIPAGEFSMGSNKHGPDTKPVHRVYLDAYYIGKYEVTNEEYFRFWEATQSHTPESFSDEYGIGVWPERALTHPRHPVVGVSWHDAVAYAEWVGMRLPTEAEWEKAARGPTDRLWPWGGHLGPYANTWEGNDGYDNGLAPVGSFPKGKGYYGAMDMAGNVWEWVSDYYSDVYYFQSPRNNPKGAKIGSWRVLRGGSWIDDIKRCTTAFRFYFYPNLQTSFIGFRLAKDAP